MSENEKRKKLWENLSRKGGGLPDYETFSKDMSDPSKRARLHAKLVSMGGGIPDYETFSNDIASDLVRKVPEIPAVEEPTEAKVPFAQPPPQQVGGEGALEALGEYAPTIKKALSSEQASPSLDGQLPSESPAQTAQGGRMPFQGALAKEPRKPELIATQAVEKGREGKETKDWWEPMPDAERKVLEDRLKNYNVIRDFSPGVVAEKNKIIERLKKDDELRNHPEKYNPNHPEYAFLANKQLKQELWPDYDVRRLAGQAPKAFPTSPDDILAGYKQSSIDPSVLEDPSIWQQLGLVPLSPQGKAAIQESLFEQNRSAGGFMSSPTGLGSIEMGSAQAPKRILSVEEKQKAKNALELDEAVRKGLPTLSLEGNPTASLVHHNRVIAKKANEFYDGDVSRYMDITESRNIIPNYLSELDQQENKILSDIRSMESVWKTQVAAGNNDIAAETFKAITKKKDEYTKLVAQKQLDVTNEIRALSQSDDPEAKRKIEVLRAQNQLFMMTDEEREKFALKKAVPNVDELKETVFKGMSDRDILRLALHTKHLQLQEILPDNVVAKGFDAMRVTDMLDEDVRRLKQEIAILAPVVFLNKTPIKKIDEGFFSTAGKAFGAGFGGEGTERTRASKLSQVLQDYGVMEGVAPEAATGMEAAQAVESWSAEEAGELVGTSGEFMVKLIPTAILTEMGLGSVGIAAQVKRGADVLKLIGRVANSRKALYAGRALEGTYEAVKQGLSYELGGRLYDQESEMDFLSGALGGVGGFVAGGAASKLAEGVEKRILATFGNASEDVVSKMIELGKKASASGVRSIGQGIGETAEEFGEALGGIIDKSDSAAEIMKNLKEQFPDASSTLHFAAQSFLMGSIMGQSSTIGAALYKRAGNYYSQLSRGEKDKIDQLIREVDEVGAEVKKEVEKPKEEIASIDERLNKVQTRIAQIESGNRIVGKEGVALNFPDELATLKQEENQLIQKREQLKPTADAVQERTTEEVGAQPVGPKVTGQEGGAGVGPSVQGPTAPQAGRAEGEVTPTTEPTAEGPVRPEAPQQAGSVGVGGEKSDSDIEKRMAEIEGAKIGTPELAEFNALEKEMEKRERATVFNVPLEKVNDAVDALMKKEKEQPNGYGSFIEKRDARETKEVADRYLNAKELTDAELRKDFKDAVMGNPDTWYADGLKLRESMKEASNRGIDTQGLVAEVEKEFIKDGYTSEDAKETVARRLAPIFKGSQKVNEKQIAEQSLKETPQAGSVVKEAPSSKENKISDTAPTPNKETVAKMKELDKVEEKMSSGAKKLNAPAKKAFNEMVASDPRLEQVKRVNFEKAVTDLEKSGKLKVRCP